MTRPPRSTPEELAAAAEKVRRFWESGSQPGAPRRAQRFRRTFDKEAVEDLIVRCARHRWAIGPGALVPLIGVPEKDRNRVLTQVLKERLTVALVRDLVALKFGPRRSGGRPRRTATDPAAVMNELERLSEGFLRYRQALRRVPAGQDRPVEAGLPPGVVAALDAAAAKVESLQEVAAAELKAVVLTRRDTRSTGPVETPRLRSRQP